MCVYIYILGWFLSWFRSHHYTDELISGGSKGVKGGV